MTVHLQLETEDVCPPLVGWLDVQTARIAALAGVSEGQMTLAVVNDARMTRLHEQYKGEATTTDVLSFDYRDKPGDPLEADVVICLDQATAQARERGHAIRLEVLLYAVHGLLHMLGQDDQTPDQQAHMHRREDELLCRAGFGPVYQSGP